MSEESVSVIIPTCDDEPEDLRRSIDCVLGQSHADIELIVVDDGSKTPFAGVRDDYGDGRICWIENEQNRGVAARRNQAAAAARCGLLAFLDCGDLWRPKKLERQLDVWREHSGERLVYSGALFVKDGREREARPVHRGELYPQILAKNLITGSASSVLLKKEHFDLAGGFDDSGELPEDHDLWIRLSKEYAWDFVKSCDVEIRVSATSRSAAVERKKASYLALIGKWRKELAEHGLVDRALCNYFERIAEMYKRTGDRANHARWALLSLAIEPGARGAARAATAFFEAVFKADLNDRLGYRKKER